MPNLKYITVDLESPIADYKCDVQNLPFGENEFDVVICNHVFEHVDDDALAMKEIFRVMKPGAFAILLVPLDFKLKQTYEDRAITSQKERTQHFGQYDHKRIYGLDYPERLKKAGFLVPSINFLNEINDELFIRYGLPSEELMYAYQKPHLD
jgi:ubiquinone/menaquinone biosynthesis C-methylase UbiE